MAGHSPDDVTKFERETWNRCAQNYQETFVLLTNEAAQLLMEAANVKSGTHVLDIGSGPGNVAGQLVAAGADVDAVDYSEPGSRLRRRITPTSVFTSRTPRSSPSTTGPLMPSSPA